MPANLPPQYFEAEKRFRLATTAQEKIAILREMLAIMPHHKGTDGLRAELNTKIAKLNKEIQKKRGPHTFSYFIKKEGAGQVILIGLPNSGKSKLLCRLTNSTPEVAPYPFTTTSPVIGMLQVENIQIQLIELPALTHEFTKKWLSTLAFSADLLIFVIDLNELNDLDIIEEQINRFGHKKTLLVGNKLDLPYAEQNLHKLKDKYTKIIGISCEQPTGLEKLKKEIYTSLNIIRVYTKEPGKEPELTEPLILPKGSTVLDAARQIHKHFVSLKYARVWGTNKFEGQRVARDHELSDGNIVEFHI